MQVAEPLTAQFTGKTEFVLSSFYTCINLNTVEHTHNFDSPVKTPLKSITQLLSVHIPVSLRSEIKFSPNINVF